MLASCATERRPARLNTGELEGQHHRVAAREPGPDGRRQGDQLDQWNGDQCRQQAECEPVLPPEACGDEAPGGEHEKRQGREFNKRKTQGVALAGPAERKRKDQQDQRRDRDTVPLVFPFR